MSSCLRLGVVPRYLNSPAAAADPLTALLQEAIVLREEKHAELSLQVLEIATGAGLHSDWIDDNRARALLALDRAEEAEQLLRALCDSANEAVAAAARGQLEALGRPGQPDGSAAGATPDAAGDPPELLALLEQAIALREQGNARASLNLLEQAQAAGFISPWLQDNRARALVNLGQRWQAMALWQELASCDDPDLAALAVPLALEQGRLLVAELREKLGRLAAEHGLRLETVLQAGDSPAELEHAILVEAIAAREGGQPGASLALLEAAVEAGLPSGWLQDNRARALVDLERHAEALDLWRQLHHGADPQLVQAAAEMLMLHGRRAGGQQGRSRSGITLLRWLIRLGEGHHLLVGCSATPRLRIDRCRGRIETCAEQSECPAETLEIHTQSSADGPCWGYLWQGPLPTAGFSVEGQNQYPQRIDLSQLPWPASAMRLLATINELELADMEIAPSLELWLGPALQSLQPCRSGAPRISAGTRLFAFAGVTPEQPRCSVVIPLYRRFDMLKNHLLNLASEYQELMGELELIIVLDDPSIADPLLEWCAAYAHLYNMPFRLAIHPENHGFAQACNSGALLARARHLVLMNSDVFPVCPGWLGPLCQELAGDPRRAVVAPLLLYPDGSLQHAGMESRDSSRWPGLMLNRHPGKGLAWGGGTESRPMPLLSAACWVVDRELFLSLDGFRTDLIQGDGEDSAFCRRLQEAGLEARLVPSIAMIHAERQSFSGRSPSSAAGEQLTVLANLWLSSKPAPSAAIP